MTRNTILVLSAVVLAACNNTKPADQGADKTAAAAEDPHAGLNNMTIDSVASMVDGKSCVPVDANGAETRDKYGVLPGAVLLSDSHAYKSSELPTDKNANLVFYCGSTKCTAAPKAAKLAIEAGYKNVSVMPDGIKGWVAAGKPVNRPNT